MSEQSREFTDKITVWLRGAVKCSDDGLVRGQEA